MNPFLKNPISFQNHFLLKWFRPQSFSTRSRGWQSWGPFEAIPCRQNFCRQKIQSTVSQDIFLLKRSNMRKKYGNVYKMPRSHRRSVFKCPSPWRYFSKIVSYKSCRLCCCMDLINHLLSMKLHFMKLKIIEIYLTFEIHLHRYIKTSLE